LVRGSVERIFVARLAAERKRVVFRVPLSAMFCVLSEVFASFSLVKIVLLIYMTPLDPLK
jgi:hypothetical protein